MRVEVITRHAVRNYGSVLQTIATNELVRATGNDCRIVDYRQPGYSDTGWSVANRGSAKNFPLPARLAYAALRDPGMRSIGRVFERDLRDSIELTKSSYRSMEELSASTEFSAVSAYCAGSDQVWNVQYNLNNGPYYLEFAPHGAKRFSLASSLGMASLPKPEENRLLRALEGYSGISVRESETVEYLSSLGVEAELHVDPTLGVGPSFWRSFAGAERRVSSGALVYQLNGSSRFQPVVAAVKKALKMPVRRIEYWRGPRSLGHTSTVLPSIRGFVGAFRDAEFIVTDSFHGVVFSILFSKPFVVVAPPKYSARITSLLAITGQEHRLVTDPGEAAAVASDHACLPVMEELLTRERERIDIYLREILNGK